MLLADLDGVFHRNLLKRCMGVCVRGRKETVHLWKRTSGAGERKELRVAQRSRHCGPPTDTKANLRWGTSPFPPLARQTELPQLGHSSCLDQLDNWIN